MGKGYSRHREHVQNLGMLSDGSTDAQRGSLEPKLKRKVKPDHEVVLRFSGRH